MAGKRSAPHASTAFGTGRMSAGQWVACAMTGAVIAASLGGYGWYQGIVGNITTTQIDTDSWGDRPISVEGVQNVLVIGSDVRAGENADYGDAEGARPDTMLIASINVDSGSVVLVNLPRDLVVDMPACEAVEGYPGMAAQNGMINSAMTFGGVSCQGKVVEQVTGVHLDHFVMMDFVGFKDMVDAIGGVPMCIPEPIDDPKAHLVLDAGQQVLDGEQSLGFVRSRDSTRDGSDLSRIERQQEFMGAMLRKVLSSEVMTSPASITGFLGAVTDSMTTDDELTIDAMADLAIAMREVDLDRVKFLTVPNGQHPGDANRVIMSQPAAGQLFEAINSGQDLTGGGPGDEDGDADGASEIRPEDVTVEVLNHTATEGLAAEAAAVLAGDGFAISGTGNPVSRFPESTTVYHGPGQEAAAGLVARQLTAAQVEEAPDLGTIVELVIGPDWGGFASGGSSGSTPSLTEDLGAQTAEDTNDACG